MSGVSKGGTSRRRRTWTKLCSKRNLAMQAKFKNLAQQNPISLEWRYKYETGFLSQLTPCAWHAPLPLRFKSLS